MKMSLNHCIFLEFFNHPCGLLVMLVHDEPHLLFKHVFFTSRQTCGNYPYFCRQSFFNLIYFFCCNIDWHLCKVSVLTSCFCCFYLVIDISIKIDITFSTINKEKLLCKNSFRWDKKENFHFYPSDLCQIGLNTEIHPNLSGNCLLIGNFVCINNTSSNQ